MNPFPANLGEVLQRYPKVLVPEMNMGQLASLLRDKLGIETVQLNKVTGQPFLIAEIVQKIRAMLAPAAVRGPRKAVRGDRA
jgi:2-oxoglutarate ferredoxin oxidoreductase subunit alpha